MNVAGPGLLAAEQTATDVVLEARIRGEVTSVDLIDVDMNKIRGRYVGLRSLLVYRKGGIERKVEIAHADASGNPLHRLFGICESPGDDVGIAVDSLSHPHRGKSR